MLKIEFYRVREGRFWSRLEVWRWRVIASNGRVLAVSSESYPNLQAARYSAMAVCFQEPGEGHIQFIRR